MTPLNRPGILLVISVVPGLFFAPDVFAVVRTLVMWTLFVLVFQLVVEDGRRETVRRLLLTLALAAAVVAATAVVRSGGQPAELSALGDVAVGRATGSFTDPNILGTFLALALPGALALGLGGPPAWRPLGVAAFCVTFAGLALSLSRGGLVAAAAAMLVLLAWRPFRRLAAAAALVVALLLATGANPLSGVQQVDTVVERVVSIGYAGQSQTDQRLEIYRVTPQIIADHPVFGVGANQYSIVAPRYGLIDPTTGFTFDHAHDVVLTVGAELGLVGLVALLWLTVALARVLWRGCRRVSTDRGLVLAVTAALAGLAIEGLVDYTVRSNVIAALFAVLAACAVVLTRPPDTGAASPPP
jgi:O-antigen ligase